MGCDGKDFILSALFPVGLLIQNRPDGLFEDGAGLIELEGYGSEGHEQEYGFAPRPRTDEIDAEALAASERIQRNAHGREGIQQDVNQAADAHPNEQIVADAADLRQRRRRHAGECDVCRPQQIKHDPLCRDKKAQYNDDKVPAEPMRRLTVDAPPYFLVAPRHCRIHHIGQHTPDHYGEQRRRMRACRERSRYSHCLVRKPLHASSDDKEEKRHSTVSPPQRSSVFAPYPETALHTAGTPAARPPHPPKA